MKLKELKNFDFFTKKPIAYPKDSQVWVKGDYDRSLKKYYCFRFGDVNDFQYIKADTEVYTDFTF